jgi:hypothetical protein
MSIRKAGSAASAALAALALSACQEAQRPAPPLAEPLPAQVCSQAREALEKVSRAGIFEYGADGQATIEEAVWLPMAPSQREALAQALAFHAACSAKEPPLEQTVTIRSEGGRVLTQRVVETSVDMSRLLEP